MKDVPSVFFGRRANLMLGLAVGALVVLYATVFIARPDQWFADDSYFYLQVAWNFARGMGSTFNNIMPTNGYHPLWMLICAAVYKVVPSKTAGVHGIAVVISALDVLMLWTVRRLMARVAGDLWILAFPLLITFCFLSQLGTEGALSGLFLSLLMTTAYGMSEAPTERRAWLFSLVVALTVLSRLDNVFIVGYVWLAVWAALGETGKRAGRRLQVLGLAVPAVLWGIYIGSNLIYFHTVQPISGMLKSSSPVDHKLGANLPHTAWFAVGVIVVCFTIVAMWKRDLFFRTVEAPFALGVLTHFGYIVLKMSNETRWTWYYTSWILLGSVLLARAGSVLLEKRRWLAMPAAAFCVLLLAAAWFRVAYHKDYLGADIRPPANFNEVVYKKAGIHRALAYDQPGSLAYYSDVQIVPLDGLMGNLEFQHDLAAKGIRQVVKDEHLDGFIGPPMPFDEPNAKSFCGRYFLSAETLHCAQDGPGHWQATSLDVFSRVPSAPAGTLALNKSQVVWGSGDADWVSVWRIDPDVDPVAEVIAK